MDIGRIFFYPLYQPERATIIPLQSHVNNVARLVEAWRYDIAYRLPVECDLSLTRDRLINAAQQHDAAKPITFKVTSDGMRWGYSFAGHRFKVNCEDLYTDALIKMHHEFSVDGVAEWQARLGREMGGPFGCNFPFDLYTLEMCDQVAAEAECYAFTQHTDERVFMELHSRMREDGAIEVEPFPFEPSPLTLSIQYIELDLPKSASSPDQLTNYFRKAPQPQTLQERKVILYAAS